MSNGDCVYIIGFKEVPDYYKIGFTNNLKKRLEIFEWASPFRVVIVRQIVAITGQRLERELHKRFADKRVKLEWFHLDETDIAYIMGIPDEVADLEYESQQLDKKLKSVKDGLR